MILRTFVICQPDETVPVGAIEHELSSLRCTARLLRTYETEAGSFEPGHYAGLIVLGGGTKHADGPKSYLAEKKCIKQAVAHCKPVFGICLGAQLLALECGGGIGRSSRRLDKG